MKVLVLPIERLLHPYYDDIAVAIGRGVPIELYDPSRPFRDQLLDVGVVVDFGVGVGSAGRPMADAARSADVKLWQLYGAGVDAVDIAYFCAKGLRVANLPGQFSAIALAEHAFLLMLCLAKKLADGQASVRAGTMGVPFTNEIHGKTLCLIGLGQSGRELARRAVAFGMRVQAIDSAPVPAAVLEALQLDWFGDAAELDGVLPEADYISIHVPLTAATRHLIDRRRLALLKPSAVIINVARGALIEEDALVDALRNGALGGAGLDVFATEPPQPGNELLKFENVVTTPHHAGASVETSRRRAAAVAENVQRVVEGKEPLYLIAEQ